MHPLVSVIIPVFNGELYLSEAIESLLAQRYPSLEILVVNDGSQDRTEEVIQQYRDRVCLLSQSNRGQPSAMNRGIFSAKGKYISFLDADDLHLPQKVECQVDVLEKEAHIDLVFGFVEQFFSPDVEPKIQQKWVCPPGPTPAYLAGTALFRRECFEKVGLFIEEQKIGNFIDWYMRAQELNIQLKVIDQLVLRRRIHGRNMGVAQDRAGYLQVIKAALQRRR